MGGLIHGLRRLVTHLQHLRHAHHPSSELAESLVQREQLAKPGEALRDDRCQVAHLVDEHALHGCVGKVAGVVNGVEQGEGPCDVVRELLGEKVVSHEVGPLEVGHVAEVPGKKKGSGGVWTKGLRRHSCLWC